MEYLAGLRAGNIAREQAIIDSGGDASPWWSDYNYWQKYLDRTLFDGKMKWPNGNAVQDDYYDGVWEMRRDLFERMLKYEKREGGYIGVTTQRPSFGYEPEKVRRNSRGFAVEARSRSESAAVSRAIRTLKQRGLIVVYPSESISLTAEGLQLAKSYQLTPAHN